jgi:hypothetical protein
MVQEMFSIPQAVKVHALVDIQLGCRLVSTDAGTWDRHDGANGAKNDNRTME